MSNQKRLGIAAGAVALVAGTSVGGYMLLSKGGETAGDAPDAAVSSAASASSSPDAGVPLARAAETIPESVDLYLEIPSIRGLAQSGSRMKVMNIGLLDLVKSMDQVGSGFAKAFALTEAEGTGLVSSFKSVAIAARSDPDKPFVGGVVSSSRPELVEKWLAHARFSKSGLVGTRDKYTLGPRLAGDEDDNMYVKAASMLSTPPEVFVVWLADKGFLAVGTDAFLEGVAEVAAGKAKALSSSTRYAEDIKGLDADPGVLAYVPASALAALGKATQAQEAYDAFLKDPGPFLLGVYVGEPGINMTVHGGFAGTKVPVFTLPAPFALDLARKLPADTLGYFAFSTKLDLSGAEAEKKLVELVTKYQPDSAPELEAELAKGREKLGVGLAELVDAVGDQSVVGVVTADLELGLDAIDKIDFAKNVAVISLTALADAAGMKKLFDAVLKVAPVAETHTVSATPDGGFEARPKGTEPFVAVRYPNGDLFVGVGAEALVQKAHDAIAAGAATLGADKAHALGLSGVQKTPRMLSWFDASRVMRAALASPELAAVVGIDTFKQQVVLEGDQRFTLTNAFGLETQGPGYRYRVDLLNSLGVLPALGVFGVSRYMANVKASEAKNGVGAIARGALAAFEREGPDGGAHRLCESATPVPAAVPAGNKYQPSTTDGTDYDSGDDGTGWRCLRFAMTTPQYYQYGYTAGGPYRGPALGGPDPGPGGFEAWAIGDVDGDGVTSLFTLTGRVDATTGTLRLGTEMFIDKEQE